MFIISNLFPTGSLPLHSWFKPGAIKFYAWVKSLCVAMATMTGSHYQRPDRSSQQEEGGGVEGGGSSARASPLAGAGSHAHFGMNANAQASLFFPPSAPLSCLGCDGPVGSNRTQIWCRIPGKDRAIDPPRKTAPGLRWKVGSSELVSCVGGCSVYVCVCLSVCVCVCVCVC